MARGKVEAGSAAVEVSILGPLRAVREDVELPLGGRRQQAVLARLVLAAGRTVPSERLVDDIWDGSPPASAIPTLQSYVSNLRRILGDDGRAIAREGPGYRLRPEHVVSTSERFEGLLERALATADLDERLGALEEAASLWRGSALGELADEPWAVGDAVRLSELRLAADEARYAALIDLGRAQVVVGDLEALARAHPLRERFTSLLVLALYRSGRQAEALRAYERQREHLAEELGLTPSPDLVRLANQVLEQDPELDAPSADGARATAGTVDATPNPNSTSMSTSTSTSTVAVTATRTPGDAAALPDVASFVLPLPPAVEERRARTAFVGRSQELAALGRAWSEASAGVPRLALLSGEPGAGKTRIAQQVARQVHEAGGNVLWGRCATETLLAFQPLVEAFRTASRLLQPEVAAALALARPPIAVLLPDVTGGPPPAGRTERWELFEAMVDLVEDATVERPLLLVIDDLQWADPSTILLLDHLVRQGRDGRLMVLATARRPAGRPTVALDQLVIDLRRHGSLVAVDVGGMSAPDVASLLHEQGIAVTASHAEALSERTGGNPFFLEALVEHGSADVSDPDLRSVPATVRDLLDDRLQALGGDALQVLTAAAVIGPRFDLAVLGAVVDLDPEALLDVVDQAVAARLLVEDEELGWVSFPHALVRSALVVRTTRNREALLHLRVADALEGRPQLLDREATVATHLLAAGRLAPAVRTADAAVAAGRRALTGLADEDALTWGSRALEVLPPEPSADPAERRAQVEALVLLSEAERLVGRPDPGRPAYRRALDMVADGAVDPDLLVAVSGEASVWTIGHTYPWGLDEPDPAAVALLERALDAVPEGEARMRVLLQGWASMAFVAGPSHDRAVAFTEQALAAIDAVADDPTELAMVILNCRQVIATPDELDRRIELLAIAVELEGITDFGMAMSAAGFASTGLLEAGRFDEAAALREEHRRRIDRRDGPYYTAYRHFLDGAHASLEGRLDEADALYALGSEIGEPGQTGPWSQWDLGRRIMDARARGEEQQLAELADQLVARRPGSLVGVALRARAQLAAGDQAGAAATAASIDRVRIAELGRDLLGYLIVDLLAEVALRLGDAQLGRAVATVAAPWSGRVGVVGQGAIITGPTDLALGRALAAAGDLDAARAALERVETVGESQGWAAVVDRARAVLATLPDLG